MSHIVVLDMFPHYDEHGKLAVGTWGSFLKIIINIYNPKYTPLL